MRNLNRILILVSLVAAGISAKAVTEITYWLWDNNQLPAYQACAAEFEKQNPDIKIKISQTGWFDYWTALNSNGRGATALRPDRGYSAGWS
jgi:multiple sugar transport system substrate-binding protein